MFEAVLTFRRRKWEWRVCDRIGKAILLGTENTRAEARYQAERSIFLLLMATRPKSCPFKRTDESKQDRNADKCSETTDAAYACETLACLSVTSKKH